MYTGISNTRCLGRHVALQQYNSEGIVDHENSLFYILGCPSIVSSDCDTETTALAASHMALRHNHQDEFMGEKSFQYGSSTTNTVKSNICASDATLCLNYTSNTSLVQRIESW